MVFACFLTNLTCIRHATFAFEFKLIMINSISLAHCLFAIRIGVQKAILKDSTTSDSGIKSFVYFAKHDENSNDIIGVVENHLQWSLTNTVCQANMECHVK